MIIILLFFIYGLVIGSFCNVVIFRLQAGENVVVKKSHCTHCGKDILWRDNIPVFGYLFLRGKCRGCQEKISIQYPLVEILSGGLFAITGYFYVIEAIDPLLAAIFYVFAFACLIVIFVYDLKYMEIPMSVMWGAIGLLFVANIIIDFSVGNSLLTLNSVVALHSVSAGIAFLFFFSLSYFSDETWMGYGDAFVAIAIGLLLGPVGTFVALLIAFCIGAIYGVMLMLFQNSSMKTEVPFGPFLIFGMICVFIIQNTMPEYVELFI